jgi:predicted RNA-binding protein with EMAP domain
MTFDQVADAIQNNYIFGETGSNAKIQCSDKILVANFNIDNFEWIITEE